MILSAHQPAYLPWLGWFHKIAVSDAFVILDKVQFEKNSFINRNQVKIANGKTWLTIPVSLSGHKESTISDIKIVNNHKWAKKHWKTIEINYKKAPYFYKYKDYFETLYSKNWTYLIDNLLELMKFFIDEVGISTKIYKQSELGFNKKKQELILEMCEYFDADIFVFGKLGVDYAEKILFEDRNIKIFFQEYKHPTYPQLYGEFISHLSIIDLLFNVGPENALDIIMKGNISKSELKKI